MPESRIWAIVLAKPLRAAKRRLASVLDRKERAALAQAMLEDVLTQLTLCGDVLAGTVLVASDPEVASAATAAGVAVLRETRVAGMNAAVRQATALPHFGPDDGAIVLPADVPQIRPEDVKEIAWLLRAPPAVVLARAVDGGTNVLACRPACVVAPQFGRDSFERHCRAARAAGIEPSFVGGRRLARDVDRPDDLATLLALGPPGRSYALLTRLGIEGRLARMASVRPDGYREGHVPVAPSPPARRAMFADERS